MNLWLAFAALNGALSVVAGAYAAHGGLSPEAVGWFEKAVRLQMVHALALIAVVLLGMWETGWSPALTVSAGAFCAGLVLFCGGLYGMALTGNGAFGRMAPLGGMSFIIGWLALAWYGLHTGIGPGIGGAS